MQLLEEQAADRLRRDAAHRRSGRTARGRGVGSWRDLRSGLLAEADRLIVMTAPRLARPDLRVMEAYPGEHFPVEVTVEVGPYDEETGVAGEVETVERQLRCGCRESLALDWPHA